MVATSTTTQTEATEDFHDYVNKQWLDDPANVIPDEYTTWGGFTILSDQGLKNQIKLVKDLCQLPQEKLSEDQKKITAIWQACQDRFTMWEKKEGSYEPMEKELALLNKHFSGEG